MLKLFFPLRPALELAEHAAAAPRHTPSFSQDEDGLPGRPSLVWVKDDGTDLMTNGGPRLLRDQDDPQSNVVVYAEGWGPGSRQEISQFDGIGGDDFAEYLDLAEPLGVFPSLLEAMRATANAGFAWLVLTVHDDTSYLRSLQRGDRP